MTGNKYLLDTNIISAWLKKDTVAASRIDNSSQVFIPITAVGEMYYGAQFSSKIDQNINNISLVISHYNILFIDEEVCKSYGLIKASLRKKGKPIPENDIWIAAIAIKHSLILATRDHHFDEIDGLIVENW